MSGLLVLVGVIAAAFAGFLLGFGRNPNLRRKAVSAKGVQRAPMPAGWLARPPQAPEPFPYRVARLQQLERTAMKQIDAIHEEAMVRFNEVRRQRGARGEWQ